MSGERGKAAKEPPDGATYAASSADLRKLADDFLHLAVRLGQMLGAPSDSAFRFGAAPVAEPVSDYVLRRTRAPLPDPRLLRRIIRQRRLRARFFGGDLFADPAWDMLLDLAAARGEHKRVSVSSLCLASNVPPTTALRWIAVLTDAGLLDRVEDDLDRRRTFVALTERAADTMARYFAEIGAGAGHLV